MTHDNNVLTKTMFQALAINSTAGDVRRTDSGLNIGFLSISSRSLTILSRSSKVDM